MTAAQRQAGDAGGRDDAERDGLAEGVRWRDRLRRSCSPAPTRTVCFLGSTRTPFIVDRSMTRPSSTLPRPGPLWPPPRMAIGSLLSRPKLTAAITSATSAQRAMSQRPLVDHGVVELSRLVIIRMVARNDEATEPLGEVGQDAIVHHVFLRGQVVARPRPRPRPQFTSGENPWVACPVVRFCCSIVPNLSAEVRRPKTRRAIFFKVPSCKMNGELADLSRGRSAHVIKFHALLSGSCRAILTEDPTNSTRLDTGEIVVFPMGDGNLMSSAAGMHRDSRLA